MHVQGETMKRSNIASVLTTLALALGLATAASAQNTTTCNNGTLKGSFGYSSTGTLLKNYVLPPFSGPFAEVGVQRFDGNGNTSATATLSSNGNIVAVTVTGT